MKTLNTKKLHFFLTAALLALLLLPLAALADSPPAEYNDTANYRADYGFDAGDPIAAANGAYHFEQSLLSLGGPMDLGFRLIYHSDQYESFTWAPVYEPSRHSFEMEKIEIIEPGGNRISFKQVGGEWTLMDAEDGFWSETSSVQYVLKEVNGYFYMMDPIKERVYVMTIPGSSSGNRLQRIIDRNGNQLVYTYGVTNSKGIVFDFPSRIEDTLGRSIDIEYINWCPYPWCYYPSTITDQAGRNATLTWEEHGADNNNRVTLRSVTDAMGATTTFSYTYLVDSQNFLSFYNLITAVTRPLNNVPYTQTYEIALLAGLYNARVLRQQDAYGNATDFTYSENSHHVTVQRPDGAEVDYEHYSYKEPPKSLTDATGKTITFTKNITEQLTSVTDRLGDTTSFTYHPETGKLASVTNAKGDTISYTYTPQDQTFTNPENSDTVTFTFYNLTRVDYPDGTYEQFTYDASGNMLTRTDRAGKTWHYTYNARGQVLTVTNPAGGVVTYTYNADATLATSTDSDTGTTTYGYDAYKRLNRITHPDGKSVQMAYDLDDRLTSLTDENSHTTTYTYDKNGNMIRITDPSGKSIQYVYDKMDRRKSMTDRLGKVTNLTYDNMGRLASVTDPNGVAVSYGYDPRGWQNKVTLGGKSWQTGYDDEGIPSSASTPLSHTTTLQSDKLGYISAITNPLSQTTTFERDALARLTGITDPLGRKTAYSYDEAGRLSGVTAPVIGTATYGRDALGLLDQITDLNGNDWTFAYTGMGRPASATGPLSHTRQYTYDTRGRLSAVTYADASTQTISYDGAGNVLSRSYSDGAHLQYTYDALDRLLTASGISFQRDAEGRITGTTNAGTSFGATYDDGGRVKTVTYNNGLFTVTYQYDSRNLLTQVSDSLTGATVRFTYDDDARLTGITRSNGVNASFSYDAAGRIKRIQDGSTIDLQYTLNAAGEVASLDMTAPLDPASLLTEGASTFSYDAASQLSSSGYTYDARGRLTAAPGHTYTWDGASRLTGIDGATLTYNGLGDLVTRGDTHYYYNYALGLHPIVGEKNDSTGQFQRYYVWTPGGGLLYAIDAAGGNKVYFYHFDGKGNTLALTDAAGAVTDAYAYSPYGQLLGHTGSSDQPFTFVGEFGVRQEGDAGMLYQMRARYYDASTARFLSRDPVWPQLAEVKELNPYQYAMRNPLSHIDPTGQLAQVGPWRSMDSNLRTLEADAKMVEAGKELAAEVVEADKELAAEVVKAVKKNVAKSWPKVCDAAHRLCHVVHKVKDYIPDLPSGPFWIVKKFFEGTPTGYQEGDPEWGPKGKPCLWGGPSDLLLHHCWADLDEEPPSELPPEERESSSEPVPVVPDYHPEDFVDISEPPPPSPQAHRDCFTGPRATTGKVNNLISTPLPHKLVPIIVGGKKYWIEKYGK